MSPSSNQTKVWNLWHSRTFGDMHDGEALSFWIVELAFVAKRLYCTKGKLYEFAKAEMKYMGGMPRGKNEPFSLFAFGFILPCKTWGVALCEWRY